MNNLNNIKQKISDNKIGIGLAIIAFVLYTFVILFNTPHDTLTGDEVFYYFQAQYLKSGEFVWFEHTSSVLYPLILSFFKSVLIILRMINAFFMSLSVFFLFKLSRLIMDDKYSILTTLLFLTNPETITLSSLLFTDTLFIFFVILSLYFYFRKITNDNFSENKMDYIILGILVGLASLTRVIGVYLVLFFLIMFFVVNNYKINLMLIKRY